MVCSNETIIFPLLRAKHVTCISRLSRGLRFRTSEFHREHTHTTTRRNIRSNSRVIFPSYRKYTSIGIFEVHKKCLFVLHMCTRSVYTMCGHYIYMYLCLLISFYTLFIHVFDYWERIMLSNISFHHTLITQWLTM